MRNEAPGNVLKAGRRFIRDDISVLCGRNIEALAQVYPRVYVAELLVYFFFCGRK